MTISQRFNSIIKNWLQRILSFFGIVILTKSDFSKNGLQPYLREFLMRECSGVMHIGAHYGQEASYYDRLNLAVLWIEADPNSFVKLEKNLENYPNQISRNVLVTSACSQKSEFYIASNDGESSSIFPIAGNKYWQGLENVGVIYLPAMKLDCAILNLEMEKYNYWVIDVQGAELEVLKGSKESLRFCRYLNLEVSQEIFYTGGARYGELKQFLENYGFFPIWNPSGVHEEVVFLNSRY